MEISHKETHRDIPDGSALNKFEKLIESRVLTKTEADKHRKKYVAEIETARREGTYTPNPHQYAFYITSLLELEKYPKVRSLWNSTPYEYKTEELYRKMLEMYYMLGDKKRFFNVLDELRHACIILSTEGEDLITFWMNHQRY